MIPLSTPNRIVPPSLTTQKPLVSLGLTQSGQGNRIYFGSDPTAPKDSLEIKADAVEPTTPPELPESAEPAEGSSKLRTFVKKYLKVPESVKDACNTVLQPFKNVASKVLGPLKSVGNVIAAPFKAVGRVIIKPFARFKDVKVVVRLRNAWDNAWGYPRHAKFVKAGIWAGATFAIGLIPPFHALIAAAPITFMTTLLVDVAVGFYEGISTDPTQMRAHLDALKAKHYPPKPPEPTEPAPAEPGKTPA